MNIKAIQINNNVITTLCAFLLISAVFAYMYFLSLSVVHVVMRKEATQSIGQLRSDIAELESTYIESKHQISARVASLDGFNHDQKKIFINRGEQSLVLRSTNE